MKTVTSISGGRSSAYIAANYPSDYLVFSLVTTQDTLCKHSDDHLRKVASEKLGREFVGTLEDDIIVQTIVDLEQFLGQEIHWVSGMPFEDIITKVKGDYLPNKAQRYCTVEMKLRPMHRWWRETIGEPIQMQIGFRSGEERRADNMLARCNEQGLMEFKDVIGKHPSGKNKWATTAWQKPVFPMIRDGIRGDRVINYWKDKPVTFAERNNCVGCFNRNPLLLRKMFDKYPNKMEWFEKQERKDHNPRWRNDMSYEKIRKHRVQQELSFDDFSECDSGHCGL